MLAANRKHGTDFPAWTVQLSSGPVKCRGWTCLGFSEAEKGQKQLSCGARMYIVTRAAMELVT